MHPGKNFSHPVEESVSALTYTVNFRDPILAEVAKCLGGGWGVGCESVLKCGLSCFLILKSFLFPIASILLFISRPSHASHTVCNCIETSLGLRSYAHRYGVWVFSSNFH